MEILLVTGAPETGKTGTLHDLTKWLLDDKGYDINLSRTFHDQPFVFPRPRRKNYDIEVLLSKSDGKRILIHSAIDVPVCVNNLCENLETLKKEGNSPDILITTCRYICDDMREMQCNKLGWKPGASDDVLIDSDGHPILEIPLLRICPERPDKEMVEKWYHEHINRLVQHILCLDPYNV